MTRGGRGCLGGAGPQPGLPTMQHSSETRRGALCLETAMVSCLGGHSGADGLWRSCDSSSLLRGAEKSSHLAVPVNLPTRPRGLGQGGQGRRGWAARALGLPEDLRQHPGRRP